LQCSRRLRTNSVAAHSLSLSCRQGMSPGNPSPSTASTSPCLSAVRLSLPELVTQRQTPKLNMLQSYRRAFPFFKQMPSLP
jgi:hypothetical protein